MWAELWGLLDRNFPGILALAGVMVGWLLNSWSQQRERRLDRISKSFDALRQVKTIVDNLPAGIDERELRRRLDEDRFRRELGNRMVRLLGLRNELIPFLDKRIVRFIDGKLRVAYLNENGRYEVRPDHLSEFGKACIDLRLLVDEIERDLTKRYEKLQN